MTVFERVSFLAVVVLAATFITPMPSSASQQPASIQNSEVSVSLGVPADAYALTIRERSTPVLRARVGTQVDHHWLQSADYPKIETTQSRFADALGNGQQLATTFSGLPNQPTLVRILRVYDQQPFGDVEVIVRNSTGKPITVQSIRVVEAVGSPRVDLGGREAADRVLSDSFSEDRPVLHIADLGHVPIYQGFSEMRGRTSDVHRAVGSQLIYNRESDQSILLASLTSRHWLTVFHLQSSKNAKGEAVVGSWTVDSTGTTEIAKSELLVSGAPAENHMELSLPLEPGGELSSECVLFAAGKNYHAQLESYGRAVRDLHHARVNGDAPQGWWSWMIWNGGITDAAVLTNSQWLAKHVKDLGYRYVLIDEGYQYARGEYITANATQFPDGIASVTRRITELGLIPGVWTAPFEVSERAWVFEHHKDWLVHNTAGAPIRFGSSDFDPLYVLDTTHPGAQEYLRQTYCTLTRDWGVKYIKLDFMDDTALEGVYYRPNTTALEAQRIGLQVIRQAVGEDVLLDKDGSPMLNTVGLVDEGRIGRDTEHSFASSKEVAPGVAARYYMHRNFFVNDPDAFSVSRHGSGSSDPLLPLPEAEVAIVLAAVSGAMFEVGGDLTMLSSEPERLALVRNHDLLQMIALNHASVPLDLMSYAPEDGQPSVFLLREDARQVMLAVFNWTDAVRSHSFRLDALGFSTGGKVTASDALHADTPVELNAGTLALSNQIPHSVRLIKLIDDSVTAAPPSLHAQVPKSTNIGVAIKVSAMADATGAPAVAVHWDFGDGISADGANATHAYTIPGVYTITVTADGVDGVPAKQATSITVGGAIDSDFHLEKNRRCVDPSADCWHRE